jgi:hypothetical protein
MKSWSEEMRKEEEALSELAEAYAECYGIFMSVPRYLASDVDQHQ